VTRLVEFSPIEQLVPLGSYLTIIEVPQIFGLNFLLWKKLSFNLTKMLGHILGDFFSKTHLVTLLGTDWTVFDLICAVVSRRANNQDKQVGIRVARFLLVQHTKTEKIP
jgi:hypothetical protein